MRRQPIANPSLSVVVPCYNAADTVGAQLNALADQQWSRPWEVIVVDNRSTDASAAVIEQYTRRFPHFRLIEAPARQGQSYALNVGIAASTADAIAICDADDLVAPGWVAAMGDALAAHDFVAGRMETQRLNPEWVYASIGNHPQLVGLQTSSFPPYLPHAGSGNLGIKRLLHDRVGGFNEEFPYLLDTEYCFRVQLAGIKLHYVPEAVVHLRYRPTVRGIYAQTRNWAQYEVRLFSQYRNASERELWRWRAYMQIWIGVVMKLPGLLCSRKGRALLAWRLGRQVGALRGSLLYRCPPVVG
ncbi:MAG TPA: glycosyltransferase [Nitrospiraceae bacterium]|nr:glycosyltransferase [Nitrospiraceae bacterium]